MNRFFQRKKFRDFRLLNFFLISYAVLAPKKMECGDFLDLKVSCILIFIPIVSQRFHLSVSHESISQLSLSASDINSPAS